MTPRHALPPHRDRLGLLRISRAIQTAVIRGPLASPAFRVWTFTIVLAAVALAGYLLRIRSFPPLDVPIWIPWPILAVGFFLAELKVIDVHFRRESHSFSVSEIPVRYRPRIGTSKISGTLSGSFHAGRIILWSIYNYTFRRPAR